MAKKLNVDQMIEFIEANINVISEKKMEEFQKMTVEEQFKRVKAQIAAKKFAEKKKDGVVSSKAGIVDKVRALFEKTHISTTDVEDVIAFCENYKTEIVEKQIKTLDDQIAELQARRAELTK